MADLQKLKKRLNSINATGEMAQAMKTVASVKYAKLLRSYNESKKYSLECERIMRFIADDSMLEAKSDAENRNCYIILGSERGFCGGFNQELHRFIKSLGIFEEDNPLIFACGKKLTSYLTEQGIVFEERHISDIASYEEVISILNETEALFLAGKIKSVYLVCQEYVNVIIQKPHIRKILPLEFTGSKTDSVNSDFLFLPDRDAFTNDYCFKCLCAEAYEDVIGHCLANQASTLSAMRNACDNAKKSSDELTLKINRIRQSQVTNSVIETSAGMQAEIMG